MKKLIALALCFILVFMVGACGAKDQPAAQVGEQNETTVQEQPSEAAGSANEAKGEFNTIGNLADEWNRLYKLNEDAVSSLQSMDELLMAMELTTPALAFVSGVQYDLLNLQNSDGRHEGTLMFAGWPGFVEKKGNKLTFGYDGKREAAGFSPEDKAGDRLVENGSADLGLGLFISESYIEREGKKLKQNYNEFLKLQDGTMICLELRGSNFNFNGEKEPKSNATYMHIGENLMDFVLATANAGTDYPSISFNNAKMTKEQAIQAFQAAGFTIENTGSLKDGKLVVDK